MASFVVLGTGELSIDLTRVLLEHGAEVRAFVGMAEDLRPENAFDVARAARDLGLAYREVSDINSAESLEILKSFEPDYILSGWPRLLESQVIRLPRRFVIGSHPTPLPRNRGRHPLHWMICLGMTASTFSFFRMDEGVDTGAILCQQPFELGGDADISRANAAMQAAAVIALRGLLRRFQDDPAYSGDPQPGEGSNYWRKRSAHDSILDPRMSVDAIVRTVRSFTLPYSCATLLIDRETLRIASATPENVPKSRYENLEHGRILEIGDTFLCLRVDDGVIRLNTVAPISGHVRSKKLIHPPTYYLSTGS